MFESGVEFLVGIFGAPGDHDVGEGIADQRVFVVRRRIAIAVGHGEEAVVEGGREGLIGLHVRATQEYKSRLSLGGRADRKRGERPPAFRRYGADTCDVL